MGRGRGQVLFPTGQQAALQISPHLPVLTRVCSSPLPAGSCASLSVVPRPLLVLWSPQGPVLSPVLVPEAAREALQAELMLQHLGREHNYRTTVCFVCSFTPPSRMEMQNNHSYFLFSDFFCLALAYQQHSIILWAIQPETLQNLGFCWKAAEAHCLIRPGCCEKSAGT